MYGHTDFHQTRPIFMSKAFAHGYNHCNQNKTFGPAQNILRPVEGRGIRPVHDAETNYHLIV
jgi:hypothetical protein